MEKVRTLIWQHSGLYYRNTVIVLGVTILILALACSISFHWLSIVLLLGGIFCVYLLWDAYLFVHPRRVNIWSRSLRLSSDYHGEPVEFYSQDGLKLRGCLLPGNTRKVVLLLHDLGGSSAMMMQRAGFLHEAGYNVILIDFRAHGSSEGDTATGDSEVYDVLGAIEYLESRPEIAADQVAVWGLAFGAHVALQAAVKTKSIRAVVLENIAPGALTDIQNQKGNLLAQVRYAITWLHYHVRKFMRGELETVGVLETLHLIYPRPIMFCSSGENMNDLFLQRCYQTARRPKTYLDLAQVRYEGASPEDQEACQQILHIFDQVT